MADSYSPGYSDAVIAFMRRRSGASHPGFFIPSIMPGMKVLDCGCGPGSITLDFALVLGVGEAVGIDLEPRQFAQANQEAAHEKLPVSFQEGSVYELPFEQAAFDAAFAHGLFSHLSQPALAMSEIRRVLKPNGFVGLRDADWGGALVYPSDSVINRASAQLSEAIRTTGGDREIGRRLGAMLRDAGFSNVRMSASFEVYDPTISVRYLARFTGNHPVSPDLFSRNLGARRSRPKLTLYSCVNAKCSFLQAK